jgi:DNA-binding NtrC family response regulator
MYRILLVDDDPTILLLLSKIVSSRGWEPLLARSGREALSSIHRADVDVVVTDFSMPGMDGLEVLGALRERDHALPVILVTGNCSERLFDLAMDAGAYRCLAKPFELAQLTDAIASALVVSRPRRRNWPARGAASELPRGRAAGTN